MWFLEHESLFGAKRVWLRPGSQQLFGRTKPSDNDAQTEGKKVFIDNKNVSRKHMMIKVLEEPIENGTKLHARSQVEITDLSCRQGTGIDGKPAIKSRKEADGSIAYEKKTLNGNEHTIRLSSSYPEFRIKWQPTVITYASKENKARSAQLHALDIKTSTEFMFNKTTHVISQKRNLPKVLTGLVSATSIVTTDYLDAILNAAARTIDAVGNYVPSKLEEDFDSAWPKENDYIPPCGTEPVPRPDYLLQPDSARSEVFAGLTFVFLTESQYNNLQEPIAGGGGKAQFFDLRPGETSVGDYVAYVRDLTGPKQRSAIPQSQLPVVTVRLSTYPDGMEDWAANFVTDVEQSLRQRSIPQNELLDAIIMKDKAPLLQPPNDVVETSSAMMPSAKAKPDPESESSALPQPQQSNPTLEPTAPEPEPPKSVSRKRPYRRAQTTTRYTGFDDWEPPKKARKVENTPMHDVQEFNPTQHTQPQSESDTKARHISTSPVAQSVETKDQLDELFPAAAAMKKRRAATRAPSASVGSDASDVQMKNKSIGAETVEKLQKARKKGGKEINVREETRKRIKQEEERRKADEESLKEALEGIDISQIKAKVEIMELRHRDSMPNQRNHSQSERWNPEWNGRRNFKKFRRRGAEQGIRPEKVLVTLEEAPPKKGFGVGDAFFLEDTEPAKPKEDHRRPKRRNGKPQDDDSEPEHGFTRRKRARPSEVVNVEDSGPDDDSILEESTVQKSSKTQRVPETQAETSQTQTVGNSRKRGSTSAPADQPPKKKGRATKRYNDDSDEEETGFRFKRRA